ncbi:MAG: hypothetical protein R2860_15500 [Desulfobacterales bacterium]
MTIEDIEQVRQAFVDAAARAREAGFDGVEILGSGGYLITQFLSPVKNQRTDAYGGSFENRVRFPKEVIEDIRKQVGPDFPVTIRMAGNDFVAGSNTDAETRAFANVYEAAGVDAISVTGGWHETHVPSFRPVSPVRICVFGVQYQKTGLRAGHRVQSHCVACGGGKIAQRRVCGYGQHRPRADCRSAMGEQSHDRTRG